MSRTVVTADAKQDLKEIRAYLRAEAGPLAAKDVLTEIWTAIKLLGRHPNIGHIRPDLTAANVRFWSVHKYLIVHDANTRPIRIMRVLHGNRDVRFLIRNLS